MKKAIAMMSVLIGVVASAAPIKSMLGAGGSERVEIDELQNPYITDGLVAMWDGEWNAGIGIHDDNAIVWKDLVGGVGDVVIDPALTVGIDSLYTTERSSINMYHMVTEQLSDAMNDGYFTIEWVGRPYCLEKTNDGFLSIFHSSNHRPLSIFGAAVGSVGGRRTFKCAALAINAADYGLNNFYIWDSDNNRRANVACVFSWNNIDQYQNGEPVYSGATDMSDSAKAGTQMRLRFLNHPTAAATFNGEVCRIAIYDRSLTPEEVMHNAAIDAERFGL